MATIITSDCINCGACEPECPNTAIYAGGVAWELGGQSNPAIAQDIYYIVPSKCTECVGFYDHEACAAVCPVDCCVTDPNNLESHEALLARARELHPDKSIGDDAPSRFHKEGGGAPAPAATAEAAPAANGAAAAPAEAKPAAAKPAAAPAAAKPAPAAAAPKPAPAAAIAVPSQPASAEAFDPGAWEVPVICKDCNEPFSIPYRHFQAGVVFYCPQCSGSFVPTSVMYRQVRDAFEGFYGRRQKEAEALERRHARERADFEARREAEMDRFKEQLEEMARTRKPAGKLVRPRGIGSMFT